MSTQRPKPNISTNEAVLEKAALKLWFLELCRHCGTVRDIGLMNENILEPCKLCERKAERIKRGLCPPDNATKGQQTKAGMKMTKARLKLLWGRFNHWESQRRAELLASGMDTYGGAIYKQLKLEEGAVKDDLGITDTVQPIEKDDRF